MGTARPSVTKRQREQLKRERQLKKIERRAERKQNPLSLNADDDQAPETQEAVPSE